VSALTASELFSSRLGANIAILRWPDEQVEVIRLDRLGLPRLLVIEADVPAPESIDCLEDWIRLPATEEDVRARLAALSHHAQRHPTAPTVDSWGQLSYRGANVLLSPRECALATTLVAHFGEAVRDDELLAATWPDGDGSATALRVHATRLRKRVRPIGLSLTSVRGYGYLIAAAS
jgi:hypothetical protein